MNRKIFFTVLTVFMSVCVQAQSAPASAATSTAPSATASSSPADSTFDGRLIVNSGKDSVLQAGSRTYALTSNVHYLHHTLEDARLSSREVRVLAVARPDGTLEVHRIYTVRAGKLFKIRYFCDTCNITAVQPGNCVCCGQPTKLQEIPITDADK